MTLDQLEALARAALASAVDMPADRHSTHEEEQLYAAASPERILALCELWRAAKMVAEHDPANVIARTYLQTALEHLEAKP